MKTPVSYFLVVLMALSVTTTGSGQGPVLDMDGDIIFTGSYYVIPFLSGQGGGGGVNLAPHAGKYPCPLDIVQESSQINEGLPVKFSNWNSKVGFVPLNSSLNIQTDVAATMCMQPTYWWVDWFIIEEEIILTGTHFLTAGPDPKEYKGSYLLCSFFQIEETDDKNVYKIVFCPGDLPRNNKVSDQSCGYVGIIVDRYGVRRLAFTDSNPVLVQFKKAKGIESVLSNM